MKAQQEINKQILERLERIETLAALGSKNILTHKEAAAFLGYSEFTLYQMTHNHRISYYSTGGRNYFKKSDLEAYLLRQRIKSDEEINIEAATYVTLHPLQEKKSKKTT